MQGEDLKVFLSYSRTDSEFALSLAKDMRSVGVDLWIDQLDIPTGEPWDKAVENALKARPCLLIILSPASVASGNVRDEVTFAIDKNKKIIPVLYQYCDIPYRLGRLQHINFTGDYDEAFKKLLTALAAYPQDNGKVTLSTKAHSPQTERSRVGALATLIVSSLILFLTTMWVLEPDQRPLGKPKSDLPEPVGLIAKCDRPTDASFITTLCNKAHGHLVGFREGDKYIGRMEFRYALFFVAGFNAIAIAISVLLRPLSVKEILFKVLGLFFLAGFLSYGLTWVAIPIEGVLNDSNGPLGIPWVISVGILGSAISWVLLFFVARLRPFLTTLGEKV